MKRKHLALAGIGALLAAFTVRAAVGFHPTTHAAEASTLGVATSSSSLEALVDQPGPVTVETVIGADWAVPLSGLLNMNHPKVIAAGLKDHDEPIVVVFHAVTHPTRGTFIVDTGVERALAKDPEHAAVRGVVAQFLHTEKMKFRTDTASWIAAQPKPIAGVFLTHLHTDHVSGMRDVPAGTPVWVGAGEVEERTALDVLIAPIVDSALEGKPALREWAFRPDPDGQFDGVVDVFGDGTFWAIHAPGHTAGTTAYLARTPKGPVLMTGNACHTAWGWQHGVEPGTYSEDQPRSADSLARLERLVARHPSIEVKPGHQIITRAVASAE